MWGQLRTEASSLRCTIEAVPSTSSASCSDISHFVLGSCADGFRNAANNPSASSAMPRCSLRCVAVLSALNWITDVLPPSACCTSWEPSRSSPLSVRSRSPSPLIASKTLGPVKHRLRTIYRASFSPSTGCGHHLSRTPPGGPVPNGQSRRLSRLHLGSASPTPSVRMSGGSGLTDD